jgi:hypothetical protein
LHYLRQEDAANGLVEGISPFRVSLARQNFRIGARDCRTTTKAQMRRAAANAFDVGENRLYVVDAAHVASPECTQEFSTGERQKY